MTSCRLCAPSAVIWLSLAKDNGGSFRTTSDAVHRTSLHRTGLPVHNTIKKNISDISSCKCWLMQWWAYGVTPLTLLPSLFSVLLTKWEPVQYMLSQFAPYQKCQNIIKKQIMKNKCLIDVNIFLHLLFHLHRWNAHIVATYLAPSTATYMFIGLNKKYSPITWYG